MTRPIGHRLTSLAAWSLGVGACTSLLLVFRDTLHQAHVALAYLLFVLGASAQGGRMAGLVLSVLSFILFNIFFLPPYRTLRVADPLDWWVLVAYLVTATVAAQLLHRAQRAADLAGQRAREIERLSAAAEQVEALSEADRVKDALLATVSHDLRTPLTTIRAAAAEIRGRGDEAGALIEEEADRLNRMVGDLLDLSRIRAGALTVDTELIAAEDLIGAALQQIRGLPGSERIRVHLPPEEPVPVGRFSFVHALRTLVNLLENALKHSGRGEPVELWLRLHEDRLLFEVGDRGPGISAKDRARVFEPFVQTPSSDPTARGTGLGLAIARSLAEAQGGTVEVRERDGGGSLFILSLPRERIPELS